MADMTPAIADQVAHALTRLTWHQFPPLDPTATEMLLAGAELDGREYFYALHEYPGGERYLSAFIAGIWGKVPASQEALAALRSTLRVYTGDDDA